MMQRIARALCWAFTILSGITLGGGLYEAAVVTPLWTGALPGSVVHWNQQTNYPILPGNFWIIETPLYGLVVLLMAMAWWFASAKQRRTMGIAIVCGAAVMISTLAFFIPILRQTIMTNGTGLPDEQITALAHRWVNWNWLRVAVAVTGWLAAIRGTSEA